MLFSSPTLAFVLTFVINGAAAPAPALAQPVPPKPLAPAATPAAACTSSTPPPAAACRD